MEPWPLTPEELVTVQEGLGALSPPLWRPTGPGGRVRSVAACFVCFPRGYEGAGSPGDPGWAAAAWLVDGRLAACAVSLGRAPAAYRPGLLALREGPLLEEALLRMLELGMHTPPQRGGAPGAPVEAPRPPGPPEVLIANATGRDHPRRAGLALHLGARLGIPSVGVTTRPLVAEGAWPEDEPGAASPLRVGDEVVGCWVRTLRGARPLAVHAAWRTDPASAVGVVLSVTGRARTPEPLRRARQLAREARARNQRP